MRHIGKLIILLALLTAIGLAGCATNKNLEAVQAQAQQANETAEAALKAADEAKAEAAKATATAQEAKAEAARATATAQEAKATSDVTANKLDRMFKKAMYK
ncbi:MAG: hypothetical protein J7L69_08200 [Desulfobulbaceae bacterium]|nr:hypothetical protein [Desulfobulbaceae bacterium]